MRFVHPEAPCEPLAWPLTRELVARWFGERVAGSGAVVDGIAGVVASRVGSGPSLAEAEGVAFDLLSTGPLPSLLAPAEEWRADPHRAPPRGDLVRRVPARDAWAGRAPRLPLPLGRRAP